MRWLHLSLVLLAQCLAVRTGNPLVTLTNYLTTKTERGCRGELVHITCPPGNKVTTVSVSHREISHSALLRSQYSPWWLGARLARSPVEEGGREAGGGVRPSLTRAWCRDSARAGRSAPSPSPAPSWSPRLSRVQEEEKGQYQPPASSCPELRLRCFLFTGNIWR